MPPTSSSASRVQPSADMRIPDTQTINQEASVVNEEIKDVLASNQSVNGTRPAGEIQLNNPDVTATPSEHIVKIDNKSTQ
jgi:hypothetical protein